MKTNKHLDEQIKEALKNLNAAYDPDSWELLEQRLDTSAPKEDELLDGLVAGHLAGLEIPFYPGDWNLMERRIEAEEAAEVIENEAHLDNLAYDKLHRLEVPYQSHHWSLMAKRLEEEFSLRHMLYRYKVAEVALMLLLLLTIIRFLPLADNFFQKQNKDNQTDQFQIAPPAPAKPGSAEDAKQLAPENNDEQVPGDPVADALIPVGTTDENFFQKNNARQSVNALAGNELNSDGGNRSNGNPAIANLTFPPLQVTPLTGRLSLNEIVAKRKAEGINIPTPGISAVAGPADFLASAGLFPVESGTVPALILPQANPFQKKGDLRFSIFAAADYSYVFTPSDRYSILDTLISTDSDTTAASGYGGGILVNFKKGRWEFQTGGVYSFKRYVPNTPVFLFETVRYYVEENFHGIQQDILQVPLNLQYHFKNNGNWRFYGLTGASMNFVTSSVYEIRYRKTLRFNALASPDDTRTIREEKEFPKGLFTGGSLSDNFFITANLGLGVERFVTPNWGLFFQPNYQHYLMSEGIGTNKDKFYTLSFYLGAKISLR